MSHAMERCNMSEIYWEGLPGTFHHGAPPGAGVVEAFVVDPNNPPEAGVDVVFPPPNNPPEAGVAADPKAELLV